MSFLWLYTLPIFGCARPNAVLCKKCSVLLCVVVCAWTAESR